MNIKHSKYKNTGILFELLVRQITSDTLSGKDSKATNILKKYFVKTELGREYKLYETLSKHKNLTESKAEVVKKKLEEYAREYAKKSYTPYASEEDLLRKEYSTRHGNRDFSDDSYELTFKRSHGLDGTYVNNGYK